MVDVRSYYGASGGHFVAHEFGSYVAFYAEGFVV